MPSGGEDRRRRPVAGADTSAPLKLLRMVTSMAGGLLLVSVLGIILAPKDGGTLTLYGLVIGLNLVILTAYFPAARWLQRFNR